MNASSITGLLPNQKVNKSKPQTREQSQSMHTRTNLLKILPLNFPPANAFWFLCISGTCALLDFSKLENIKKAQRCCSWQTNHKRNLHPNDDPKFIIYSFFQFERKDNGLSWGTEYLQLEELNAHSYRYIGGELIEIESNIEIQNDNDNSNNRDQSSNEINANSNGNVVDENNHVALADSIADSLLPRVVTAITPGIVLTTTTNDNNSNNNSNNNGNSNSTNLNITSDNIFEYVECEGHDLFAIKFVSKFGKWVFHCVSCHKFPTNKGTWTVGLQCTTDEASNHRFFWQYHESMKKHCKSSSHHTSRYKYKQLQTKENACLHLKADVAQFLQRYSILSLVPMLSLALKNYLNVL